VDHESIKQSNTEILIKLEQVIAMTELSRAQIHRYRHDPKSNFPQPVSLGGVRIAWRKSEVLAYLQRKTESLTIKQVSEITSLSITTVMRYGRDPNSTFPKLGLDRKFKKSDIDEYILALVPIGRLNEVQQIESRTKLGGA
jgi:predicted DNA-binding transcriptional regulator AlpA